MSRRYSQHWLLPTVCSIHTCFIVAAVDNLMCFTTCTLQHELVGLEAAAEAAAVAAQRSGDKPQQRQQRQRKGSEEAKKAAAHQQQRRRKALAVKRLLHVRQLVNQVRHLVCLLTLGCTLSDTSVM
jgi:hypothetical protein